MKAKTKIGKRRGRPPGSKTKAAAPPKPAPKAPAPVVHACVLLRREKPEAVWVAEDISIHADRAAGLAMCSDRRDDIETADCRFGGDRQRAVGLYAVSADAKDVARLLATDEDRHAKFAYGYDNAARSVQDAGFKAGEAVPDATPEWWWSLPATLDEERELTKVGPGHVKLATRIENFLTFKRHSKGDYALVRPEDMADLQRIVERLITDKFEPNGDGEYPVEFSLVNRWRAERNHYASLPRPAAAEDGLTPAERATLAAERLATADTNDASARNALKRTVGAVLQQAAADRAAIAALEEQLAEGQVALSTPKTEKGK